MSFKVKVLQEMGSRTEDSEKKMDPMGSSAFKMLFEGENQQEIGR